MKELTGDGTTLPKIAGNIISKLMQWLSNITKRLSLFLLFFSFPVLFKIVKFQKSSENVNEVK